MVLVLPDTSRDRRIEDPSNLRVIHPAARALVPGAIRAGLSANVISCCGMVLGALAAGAYAHWVSPWWALAGLLLSAGWLIADGLDGMVARATGTASPLGRLLDGLCDHGVFILIYVVLASSIDTVEAWVLAVLAGVAHAAQSSLYEGERARFHRRARGDAGLAAPVRTGSAAERLYDRVGGALDRWAGRFDATLASSRDPAALGRLYADRAVPALRSMIVLTANTRVMLIFLACLVGDPSLFWWVEIVPLTIVAVAAMAWHRRIEANLIDARAPVAGTAR